MGSPYVLVPDPKWHVDPDSRRRCRWGAGPHRPACGAPAVAALQRTNGAWWYCPDHLYYGVLVTHQGVPAFVVTSRRTRLYAPLDPDPGPPPSSRATLTP